MTTARVIIGMFLTSVMLLASEGISGQTYPNKIIRIVTSEPSGAGDFAARLIAPGLTATLGQQLIVENRPSVIAIESVTKAPPDGYTLLVYGAPLWIGPLLRKVSYDPVKDFVTITLLEKSPSVLVVHPSLPVKSVRELIALAKAKPGELNYASGAIGGANHLAAELFKAMAGIDVARINYRSTGAAVQNLIAGEVDIMFPSAGSAMPHVKSGRLRALAVTSAEPSVLLPALLTVAASGVPGYESVAMTGIFAPAKTPETIIRKLNQEVVLVLNQPDVKEKFLVSGSEIVGISQESSAAKIASEITRMSKIIKDAGIRGE